MQASLEAQHERDRELREWVEEHKPSSFIMMLAVSYFALAGVFPYSGVPMASAPFPIIFVAIGTAYTLQFDK